jgi:hypothetical protein
MCTVAAVKEVAASAAKQLPAKANAAGYFPCFCWRTQAFLLFHVLYVLVSRPIQSFSFSLKTEIVAFSFPDISLQLSHDRIFLHLR